MLGGSFWISLLRNCMGAGLMLAVFLLLDRGRLPVKKAVSCYGLFGLLAAVVFSFWYMSDHENFVRFSGLLAIPAVGIFCIKMSGDTFYLALYKIALGFYLLSVTVFCGVDVSRLWFQGNLWADIAVRIVLTAGMVYIIGKKVRKNFLEGIDYLREEMDWLSAVTVLLSILIAALVAFWPGTHELSAYRVVRTCILFLLAGIIQYLVFQLYLHRGKERRYQVEKELLETNERLICRQLELMQESKRELSRIRQDARRRCLLVEEYLLREEYGKLLFYIRQYREELESREIVCECGNETISNILSVYARRASEENIQVTLNARVDGKVEIRDIDLVVVIANVFENAIHGCLIASVPKPRIYMSVMEKGKKIVVQCKNTCGVDLKLKNGMPEPDKGGGTGMLSALKVVSYYNGEAEFAIEDGRFTTRILLPRMIQKNAG
ncbi:hypothetical protein IMSAGC019_00552 [Lachnospiraceae bacterium]|nr:hypothetical protein IMSAGC019_00552 [Lachnospiraceae bacterium]